MAADAWEYDADIISSSDLASKRSSSTPIRVLSLSCHKSIFMFTCSEHTVMQLVCLLLHACLWSADLINLSMFALVICCPVHQQASVRSQSTDT